MNTYFRVFYAILSLFLLACGKVPTPEPNQTIPQFVGDFENGTISGFHYLVVDTAQNTQVVNYPVRKGKHALKNTLKPGDYINNGYRSELRHLMELTTNIPKTIFFILLLFAKSRVNFSIFNYLKLVIYCKCIVEANCYSIVNR